MTDASVACVYLVVCERARVELVERISRIHWAEGCRLLLDRRPSN